MLDEFMNQLIGLKKPKRRKKKSKKQRRTVRRRMNFNQTSNKDLFEAYGKLYNDIN